MQASLAELRAAGTGLADGEACGTFDWIVDFPDFAHMVSVSGIAFWQEREKAVALAQKPDWPPGSLVLPKKRGKSVFHTET